MPPIVDNVIVVYVESVFCPIRAASHSYENQNGILMGQYSENIRKESEKSKAAIKF